MSLTMKAKEYCIVQKSIESIIFKKKKNADMRTADRSGNSKF